MWRQTPAPLLGAREFAPIGNDRSPAAPGDKHRHHCDQRKRQAGDASADTGVGPVEAGRPDDPDDVGWRPRNRVLHRYVFRPEPVGLEARGRPHRSEGRGCFPVLAGCVAGMGDRRSEGGSGERHTHAPEMLPAETGVHSCSFHSRSRSLQPRLRHSLRRRPQQALAPRSHVLNTRAGMFGAIRRC
jgi:hypothetical protein